jgi:hypothetical protein
MFFLFMKPFHREQSQTQRHLDGMAVLGGCIRTGTGTDRKLGVPLIDYCASQHNPTGVNKKAALLVVETNADERGAA